MYFVFARRQAIIVSPGVCGRRDADSFQRSSHRFWNSATSTAATHPVVPGSLDQILRLFDHGGNALWPPEDPRGSQGPSSSFSAAYASPKPFTSHPPIAGSGPLTNCPSTNPTPFTPHQRWLPNSRTLLQPLRTLSVFALSRACMRKSAHSYGGLFASRCSPPQPLLIPC